MEHDEEIPAMVRAEPSPAGATIAGGDAAVAVVPPLEAGGGSPARADEHRAALPQGSVQPQGGQPPPEPDEAEEIDEDEAPLTPAPTGAAGDRVAGGEGGGKGPKGKRHPNNVRRLRIERMMSKAELARRANLSVLTIDRVEKGYGCRMDSKRKILEALGLSLADRVRVFGEEE